MLEIRNLTKIYKSKGGVTVKALDGVSIKFPSTGLVFLLGKSGSGKSTLLNVTGGLDRPDDGEIIIKGRNSKTFSGSDFDSYRNTFIGFIFQEYNILNEFNVEDNISLALQLQGKKNDREAVEKILESVDLNGFGKRKPNTLSGGQKQRIAIARALIKNPEIIMADEPTGALDSTTGAQVFDTLKKLSKEKLIIVVSHDRDFAELYGDRIIELSDGKVISDVTKEVVTSKKVSENVEVINENVISIKSGKNISKEEFDSIYELLKDNSGEIIISKGEKQIPLIKQVNHIRNDNQSEVFNDTKEIELAPMDGSKTKFIKSRLPFKRAFKMGASTLKTKPIRMLFTIFLTLVSLIMFGVASTLLLYDSNYSLSTGLANSVNDYETIEKKYEYENVYEEYDTSTMKKIEDESHGYKSTRNARFSQGEIDNLNNNSIGHHFVGIYGDDVNFTEYTIARGNYYICSSMNGFIDASLEELGNSNIYLLEGRAPNYTSEIAISNYIADSLINSSDDFSSYNDIVGKYFQMSFYTGNDSINQKFKITGIYNCGTIPYKFDSLKQTADQELRNELKSYLDYSYLSYCYVTKDFYSTYRFRNSNYSYSSFNTSGHGGFFAPYKNDATAQDYFSIVAKEIAEPILKTKTYYDFNGNKMEYKSPTGNEVYVSMHYYDQYLRSKRERLLDRYNSMIWYSKYSDALNTYITQADVKERIDSIKENMSQYGTGYDSYEEDYLFIEEIYNKYYLDFFYHRYLVDKLTIAFEEAEIQGRTDLISNYSEFYQNVIDYRDMNQTNDTFFNEKIYNSYSANKEILDQFIYRAYARYIGKEIRGILEYADSYSSVLVEEAKKYDELSQRASTMEEVTKEEIDLLCAFGKEYLNKTGYYDIRLDFTIETKEEQKYRLDIQGDFSYFFNTLAGSLELKIIGFSEDVSNIMSMEFLRPYVTFEETTNVQYEKTDYQEEADAKYTYAITRTNYSEEQIKQLLLDSGTYQYEMTNQVYMKVSMIVSIISTMKNVFLITGVVFAVFAALMLFNFISSSISSKIKEIGILRAIGTRGSDLFKIFFSESGIIAVICFVISIAASFVICMLINKNLSEGLGIKLLNFGFINAGLIIAGSIVIAILGTFIPVFIASKKAPIESIRTL